MWRVVSIVLTVLTVLSVLAALTPLHMATCTWEARAAPFDAQAPGSAMSRPAALALQIQGGDHVYGERLRALVAQAVARRFPGLPPLVDGPAPRGGHLVKVALTSGDVLWTPVHATAELGIHAMVLGQGRARAERRVVLSGSCTGLVSRSAFRAQLPDEVARWLEQVIGELL